jgi:trk system potassium uptake protein TrkH
MFLAGIEEKQKRKVIWGLNLIMFILAFIGLISIFIEYGIRAKYPNIEKIIFGIDIAIVGTFIVELIIKFGLSNSIKEFFQKYWIENTLFFLFILQFLVIKNIIYLPYISKILSQIDILKSARGYIVVLQLYIIAYFIINSLYSYLAFSKLRLNPSLYIMLSFFVLILIGSLLLYLPGASKGRQLSYIDALFMSASAICVTGLSVIDIGKELTTFGQMIILALIQIGGIGIMTIAAFFNLLLGSEFSIEEKMEFRGVIGNIPLSDIGRLIKFIFLFTIFSEAIGFIFLFLGFSRYFGINLHSVYLSLFHSVSAFCNAGFSLFSTSLERFSGDIFLNIIFILLIFVGGIGFVVIWDIWRYIKNYKEYRHKKVKRISLHSKIALITSISLIFIGAILFAIIEWERALSHFSLQDRLIISFFESATTRTAGFDTISTSLLSNASLLLFMALMIIGASPSSTGGGIKTTTFWVAISTLKSVIQNRWEIEAMGRMVSKEVMNRAIALIMIYIFSIFFFTLIILSIEDMRFVDIIFEVISAIGTVGLSTGITEKLSPASKIILTIAMYIGRIGPLTLIFAMGTSRKRRKRVRYPKEEIIIG